MEMLIRRRGWRILSAVLALGLIAGACGSDGDDGASSSASSAAVLLLLLRLRQQLPLQQLLLLRPTMIMITYPVRVSR